MSSPGAEAELWRDGVALVRARAAGDDDAVRFLLDSAPSLRDLAEMILGFSFEVFMHAMAIIHPGTSREELGRLAEEVLTSALRQGPDHGTRS
jgi:hypothetical protein